ncbi:hypothetical protein ACH9EU_02670 [Kocuria sp. M1R5S2]|uniref:hypothetical protein n=1 Tax=Kocuria rhizosphaerae TaxID=3376285 RepID=UPI0037A5F924
MSTSAQRITRPLATVLVAASLGLAGCGTEGPETGTDVEDVTDGEIVESPAQASEGAGEMAYEGEYNQQFQDEVTTYVGEQVTLSAEVSRDLTSDTFEIGGPVDPLLIVEEQEELPPVEEEQVVRVIGTVHESFDVTVVEELGIDPVEELDAYEGEPYIRATSAEIIE